ncbi:MAG: hypothetical protein IJX63_10675 [Lachnospiraceae bacterium]|nr:hypothetical protein [Lachnospiraceae bacterium]
MKNQFVIIFIRLVIVVAILCGAEYLFERLVIREVITKQSTLIWWSFILGGSIIALIGIAINHLINKIVSISTNAKLFVDIAGAFLTSVLYLIISLNTNQSIIQFNSNKDEVDYFLIVIFSLFVLLGSVIEGIICRIMKR